MQTITPPAEAHLEASPRAAVRTRPDRRRIPTTLPVLLTVAAILAACGGGGGDGAPHEAAAGPASAGGSATARSGAAEAPPGLAGPAQRETAAAASSTEDAVRLAHQATFGPSEALVREISAAGSVAWIQAQLKRSESRYNLGGGEAVHRWTASADYCQRANAGANCWRDNFSGVPLAWDFYRNAIGRGDQLRQRVAFALQQILVVSNLDVHGTYGLRRYHNALLENAFGNYRQVLRKVALSPVMGDYLDSVNNDRAAPNENFARELLQLFTIGACELNNDGSLRGGTCRPSFDNARVRSYAYALTGWTFPQGGASMWGCWPRGTNCRYYAGDMLPLAAFHESGALGLLSGVTVPAGSTPGGALEQVLDSLMNHPNMAPFIGRQLIQHLVSSNPSPGYIGRVATAFGSGRYSAGGSSFGSGQRGDLAATVAAVLLDSEARQPTAQSGKLREPVLLMTGMLRALYGRTDGDPLTHWWGEILGQHVFRPPSVFNFYPPDHPAPGTALYGPGFAIHDSFAAVSRLNYLTYLLWWDGSAANATVQGATGTRVDLAPFDRDAPDAARLVDRLSTLAIGKPLPTATRQIIVQAVDTVDVSNARTTPNGWQRERVRQAAYLVFATPDYQVQR